MENMDLIPFKMHPRVFAALGADLVTNDVVAILELVKNSYDAFAKNVWIRFMKDDKNQLYIEIEDDGSGMDYNTIENVWCVVATPFKQTNQYSVSGEKKRRVSGEKGLGRLSIARLGSTLFMLTQTKKGECWQVSLNWDTLSESTNLNSCYVSCTKYKKQSPIKNRGTVIQISGIYSEWEPEMIIDLEENLGRLISPFADEKDFAIYLIDHSSENAELIKIGSPYFLSYPKYKLIGQFSKEGYLSCTYEYSSLAEDKRRSAILKLSWEQIFKGLEKKEQKILKVSEVNCGKFNFELRVWDIASDDVEEISDKFEINKSSIRKAIKAHKGISVYRDDILILPKSENAKDWLGLDLRRVSKIGSRISTSQIVGHVSISADENPDISDTSDRERLASNREVKELESILKAAIGLLENEREQDRKKQEKVKPLNELFNDISAEDLLDEVSILADEGASASDAVPLIREFSSSLNKNKKKIQERFIYYSRMATVGSIAQMLIHEIRNQTTTFGAFIRLVKTKFTDAFTPDFINSLVFADKAIDSLERLADTFAPLANRSFRRREQNCNFKEQLESCLEQYKNDIKRSNIIVKKISPKANIQLAVDPAELDIILHNLILNSLYWLSQSDKNRVIGFKTNIINKEERLRIYINDTGPGIEKEDIEKIMLPGVTKKPDGIGMGLTIAAELVSEYGGLLSVKSPGDLNGATFFFDLPIKR